MNRTKADWEAQRETPLNEVTRGHVSDADLDYAREKIDHATRVATEPVLQLELRLTQHDDPARTARAFVEMQGVFNGRPIRAHRAAPTMHEAIDAAAQIFTEQIKRAHERVEAQHQRLEDRSSWHHGDAVFDRGRHPGVFPRPPEERALVRRKLFQLEQETIDEAAFDLQMLDHEFFLFINIETGEPNVIARDRDGLRLYEPEPTPESIAATAAPVTLDPAVAPVCSVDEARTLLALREDAQDAGPPWIFFLDSDTGLGAVLYRRHDGHDGVIFAA